jgi:hypothetical protein
MAWALQSRINDLTLILESSIQAVRWVEVGEMTWSSVKNEAQAPF